MENASKALLMAAGLLLSILVISVLIFVANKISHYQKTESELKIVTQLKDFNEQFVQYSRNDLKGTDLISLVNKVVDYNKKESGAGEINYDKKITIRIDNLLKFKTDYANLNSDDPLVNAGENSITISNTQGTSFLKKIQNLRELEEGLGLKTLDVLSSSLENLENAPKNQSNPPNPSNPTKEELLEQLLGKSTMNKSIKYENAYTNLLNVIRNKTDNFIKTIKQYREYSEFKTSKFSCTQDIGYDNGQVTSMKFSYVGK